jgi:hypothetical protein
MPKYHVLIVSAAPELRKDVPSPSHARHSALETHSAGDFVDAVTDAPESSLWA